VYRDEIKSVNFDEFELERWLSTHSGKYNFAGVNPPPVKLSELTSVFDLDQSLTYGSTCGSEKLREEISRLYSSCTKDQILVTNGTAEANFLVANAILEPGDELIIVTPTYLQILGIAKANGVKVKISRLLEDEGFKPDLDEITELFSSKTRAVFATNPNNPTGATMTAAEIRKLCEIAEERGAFVIFDEVIRGLELNDHVSISPVELYEKGISTASISKLGLLGLRIGWVAASTQIVERCWKIKDYTTLSHSGLSEYLGTIALEEEKLKWLRGRARQAFNRNLPILRDWLQSQDNSVTCVMPTSGGSVFPKYHTQADSRAFCEQVLSRTGILLSPGDYFESAQHFRFRYGGHDVQTLTMVLDKLAEFLQKE